MQKRGQFYLLTAVVLATLFIGVATVSNYVGQNSNAGAAINNARDSLRVESANTVDYGTNQGFSDAQMQVLLTNFTSNYIGYTLDSSGYFIFGTQSGIRVMVRQTNNNSVSFDDGSGYTALNLTQNTIYARDFAPTGTTVSIKINGFQYNFYLSKGENYYFVLEKESNGGNYIVTG